MRVLKRSGDRLIGGVLGGFAEHLGWPAANVRLLFLCLAIFCLGVPALLAYVVLWITMPGPDYLPPREGR